MQELLDMKAKTIILQQEFPASRTTADDQVKVDTVVETADFPSPVPLIESAISQAFLLN